MQNEQTEQRMVPSPLKQLDDPPTLTFAALKHASNPAARHSHAEKDIAAFVTAIVPAHIPYDPEKVQFTYEHGMKGWVIQCLLSLATFLEKLGRGGPTTGISVDPHEDKMGRHHVRCDYVIHVIPFTGKTSKQIRSSTDLATWYTASIPSTYLGSLEDISAAISSQFKLAALQVTNVKRQYAALGVRTGKICSRKVLCGCNSSSQTKEKFLVAKDVPLDPLRTPRRHATDSTQHTPPTHQ